MSSHVKVTNVTDVKSPRLSQFRLDNKSLEVCGQMVAPGKSAVLPKEDWLAQSRSYERLVKLGALKVEDSSGEPDVRPALVKVRRPEKSE